MVSGKHQPPDVCGMVICHFWKIILIFFIMDMVAFMQGGIGQIVSVDISQGCIICAILPSGMGVRGVSSEHVENMEMFSCSPT